MLLLPSSRVVLLLVVHTVASLWLVGASDFREFKSTEVIVHEGTTSTTPTKKPSAQTSSSPSAASATSSMWVYEFSADKLALDLFSVRETGWLGGDISGSFQRSAFSNDTVWLFGNTAIGNLQHETRHGSIIPSSVAVLPAALLSGGMVPSWTVEFYWRETPPASNTTTGPIPAPIFPINITRSSQQPDLAQLRILHGIPNRNRLVCLGTMAGLKYGMWLGANGTWVVEVRNPLDDPRTWTFKSHLWPGTDDKINWLSGISSTTPDSPAPLTNASSTQVYVLGFNATLAPGSFVLSRANLDDLQRGDFSNVEYWSLRYPESRIPSWSTGAAGDSWYMLSPLFSAVTDADTSFFHTHHAQFTRDTSLRFSDFLQRWTAFSANSTDIFMHIGGSYGDPTHDWDTFKVFSVDDTYPSASFFVTSPRTHPELESKDTQIILSFIRTPQYQSQIFQPNSKQLLVPEFVLIEMSRTPVPPVPGPPGSLSLFALLAIAFGALVFGAAVGCFVGCATFPPKRRDAKQQPLLNR